MAEINVLCQDGARRPIKCESIECPKCGTMMVPSYLYFEHFSGIVFCRCSVSNCGSYFMLKQYREGSVIVPNCQCKVERFSEIISSISPMFCELFNESYAAEQMSLMDICGSGYRKALEFLIKDYVIEGQEADVEELIKAMPLAKCIDSYVKDVNVRNVSKRAVWLGNDETHYIRKWINKDVQDLKGLIRLTIRWIEQEKETEALLLDMPEGK